MSLTDDKERKRRSLQVDQLALKHDRRVALVATVEEVYGDLLCEAPSKAAVAAKVRQLPESRSCTPACGVPMSCSPRASYVRRAGRKLTRLLAAVQRRAGGASKAEAAQKKQKPAGARDTAAAGRRPGPERDTSPASGEAHSSAPFERDHCKLVRLTVGLVGV